MALDLYKATLTFGYSSNCDLLFKAEDLNVSLSHPMKAGKFDKKEATDGYDGQEYLFLYDGIGSLSIIIIEEKGEVYPQIGWYNNSSFASAKRYSHSYRRSGLA